MNIVFRHDRHVEVDHQRQVFDVQTTGCHIGRHQNLYFAGLETIQRTLARRLRFVAVNAVSVDTQGLQLADQLVHAVAGLGEYQDLFPVLGA